MNLHGPFLVHLFFTRSTTQRHICMINKKQISILDCTLRDGGLALEDAMLNGTEHKVFNDKVAGKFINAMQDSSVDIIEIGSIEITNSDKSAFSIYQNIEQVSKLMPKNKPSREMYAALFRGPDTPITSIPKWNPLYCEGVRVIIRYSEIKKSLDFCRALAEKGYKVFVQPMVTMRYSDSEIQALIDESNSMGAYALYLVDSYGYMEPSDTLKLFRRFDEGLSSEIRIGLHTHNNMNLAFNNVRTLVEHHSNRSIIIDSTVMGMGQGAGNMQTELLVPYLNNNLGKYKYNYILDACEIINPYCGDNLWGYSVTHVLSAVTKTAYKFAVYYRKTHKLSFSKIYDLLFDIPEEYRHRFTNENAIKILELSNK
jgi:4-hydroxy 2-oxovalerate aldolase